MQYKPFCFLKSEGKFSEIRRPVFCCIEISSRCFLRCKMCFAWKRADVNTRKEPTLNEWHNFIYLLADLSNNSLEINFSGAEPLFDGRNLALISVCVSKGIATSMNTNGFLIDKDMACKIAGSGLDSITISLDSINKNTHDFLRGVEGSYDKIMQGIDYLDSYCANLTIGIQTIILENNLDEIIGLTEWVNDRKRIDHICFQAIAQPFYTPFDNVWYKKSEYNTLWPKDIKRVHAVIDELIRLKKAGFKISNPISQLEVFKAYFERPNNFIKKTTCNVDFYMTINQFGDVRTCGRMQTIGNIKKDLPKDIWYSKEANQMREEIKNCNSNCHILINCGYEED